ncbi:tRNA (guanosine(46)-N7)-methyltransferase TrmB [Mariniblastus sp.]|jgi:tRNA (guanine-N7-)-methyltransferase|nr:tRNA (guanosine(46)-N7)-methyltransferase TrmB [Mariniblastus sp.]
MGRRALPKVNPSINTSGHLFVLDDLSPPLDWSCLFKDPSLPLEIEIGSGKGLFINTSSVEVPDRNFIGVELAKRYAVFAAARLARKKTENAVMISGDGLRFMAEFVAANTLDAVHVYFPDPWWKERHRKRRVMKESLVVDVERTLKPGGTLHFWTDVKEYFDSTLELIPSVCDLAGPYEVKANAPSHNLDYRTHFERRMRLHDKPVYRSLFKKPCV